MGQKTHPLGFRLGITQKHKSTWYANFNQYANSLKEDDQIRTYLNSISQKHGISNVSIDRNGKNNQIQVIIETGKPKIFLEKSGKELEDLLAKIKKILPSDRQLILKVFEVKHPNLNASLLGILIVEQLEKRVAFRRAIREALKTTKTEEGLLVKDLLGIKIQVSGRLNGAEIARTEWVREGRVPLQTLRANIDYATKEANTIYGILGIKVWLFKNPIIVKY